MRHAVHLVAAAVADPDARLRSKNNKEFYRQYGYWRPGEKEQHRPSFNLGPHRTWSTLGVFTIDGMISWNSTEITHAEGNRGMDALAFLKDVMHHVLPYLQPWPLARSVVVCDNVSLHHAHGGLLRALIEAHGAKLLFLPT